MEASLRRSLLYSLLEHPSQSPLVKALCQALASPPSPTLEQFYEQYFRIISAFHANVPGLVGGLHSLALQGQAPELAALLPTCGGQFGGEQALDRLRLAAEEAIDAHQDELLDFMLAHDRPLPAEIERTLALQLGARVVGGAFGGGLSLLHLGAESSLLLQFDQLQYRLDQQGWISAEIPGTPEALRLSTRLEGALPPFGPLPPVVGRVGLSSAPADLTDPQELERYQAFIPPDQPERLQQLRAFSALLPIAPSTRLVQGEPTSAFAPLLTQTYNEMHAGNTLLLLTTGAWSQLGGEEQKRIALDLQSLAAQVQPFKPIAWLQIEPFPPRQGLLEMRLHTFGWADLEDRSVRRLAEMAPDLTWIRWLED